MASVDIILRTDKKQSDGKVPVYLRIIKDRKAKYISLKETVDPDLWLPEAQEVDRKHTNAKWLNAKFLKRKSEAKDFVLQAEDRKRTIRTEELKTQVIGKAPTDFFAFGEAFLQKYESPDKIGTYRSRKAMLGKFKTFYNNATLDIDAFGVNVLTDYIDYQRKELKNGNSTIHSNLKFLHTIFRQAIRENLATLDDDPFLKVKVKVNSVKREYLTKKEIEAIKKLDLDPKQTIYHHRNMFLFSCYSGGLGIREVLMLKWKDIRDGKLYFQRKKTGHLNSFSITKQGLEIIDFYRKRNVKAKENHFVFPAMSNIKDYSDPNFLHNSISTQTSLMNKSLKKIEEDAELPKHLSSHLARHTFATLALSQGIPVDQVQHILGHSNIRETMVYAKTLSQTIDNSMKKFKI
ncbi:MAG TPA: site-specific integrase [Bacteroidia bacterium]|nr:site-specific integrase [Bacteroidia bacterium]